MKAYIFESTGILFIFKIQIANFYRLRKEVKNVALGLIKYKLLPGDGY